MDGIRSDRILTVHATAAQIYWSGPKCEPRSWQSKVEVQHCKSSKGNSKKAQLQLHKLALRTSRDLLRPPLRSGLHRTFTKLWWRPIMLCLAYHLSYLEVFLASFIKVFPLLDFLLHFLPCRSSFPFCPCLSLCTTDDFFLVVYRNVDELCTPHVVRGVVEETAGHKSACCVSTSEDTVTTARTVGMAPGGHVEDGAVNGKVDGKIRIGTIVGG